MTLEQLRIFLAVATHQHVTRAAETLHLTQSAVSAAIAALETRHDVRLFDRVGRRIELTETGRLLVPQAEAVLAAADTAALMLADVADTTTGRVRIHSSQTVASYWLPERLVRFHERYPGVAIELTVANTTQVALAVMEGKADLGVVESSVARPHLTTEVVATDQLVVVVAPGHPFATAGKAPIAKLKESDWILRERGSGTRAEFEDWLEDRGSALDELRVTLDLPSNEAVLAAIIAGRSATVLSERAAMAASAAGLVVMLPLEGAERQFFVIRHSDRHRTRATMELEKMLLQEAAPQPLR
ncbi:LysR family transcriptional regulator [Rhizobium sp. EC-SD404]|uniref:LysR family transcriptional regulator n=1 Tax=Rhizobium sp. EC-SD404 TaxID=2038389 RepID=UPI0012579CEA|nr:LysR family transcriptional regulator [Rhizobium sp. EC-SD404]VVT31418.1 LysR family transcriptional regulator [Rhizobium sp. EC-SD404]